MDATDGPQPGIHNWFRAGPLGNPLLDDAGRLSAVIDVDTSGVGDPACDLAGAWTLLTSGGREPSAIVSSWTIRPGSEDAAGPSGRPFATCWSTSEDPEGAEELDRAKQTLDVILTD